MRFPTEYYQIQKTLARHFTNLRPSQQRGLALWVYGTILAQSATQSAVIAALWAVGTWSCLRQYLREWLYDGVDKSRPSEYEVDVSACFPPLVRWLLSWWKADRLALAIDATLHGDKTASLVVSVLYRGCAIPVAWHVLPANRHGAWMGPILGLLQAVRPAVPDSMKVLVMADRGLWSPVLWNGIKALGWHPLMRVRNDMVFQPAGGCRLAARHLVPGAGYAWVGAGTAFRAKENQRFGTLIVMWDEEQKEPRVVLTDLEPEEVGVSWYGLRVWIELGFRALKGVGWQWQRTRRTDPRRVARHWLVMAVATLWVMACGTRVEDAAVAGVPPHRLKSPPCAVRHRPAGFKRMVSLFRQGLNCMVMQLLKGRLWQRLWLAPEPWSSASSRLRISLHVLPSGAL